MKELDWNGLQNVPNCTKCKALTNGRCTYVWENHVLKENLCHKCGSQHDLEEYRKSGKRLRSFLTMENQLELYHLDMKKSWDFYNRNFLEDLKSRIEIQQAVDKIYDKIKEFESAVWFGGLKAIINKSTTSGVSARAPKLNDFKVLTFCSAGRTMFTLEDKDASVTAICAEDSETSTMGMQGIDATEEQAVKLFNSAIRLWKDGALKFKTDNKVSII